MITWKVCCELPAIRGLSSDYNTKLLCYPSAQMFISTVWQCAPAILLC